jgi:hypothetical protein
MKRVAFALLVVASVVGAAYWANETLLGQAEAGPCERNPNAC